MFRPTSRQKKGVAAAGVVVAVTAGSAAAWAATQSSPVQTSPATSPTATPASPGSGSTAPGSSRTPARHPRGVRGLLGAGVIGVLHVNSTTGGSRGAGTITVTPPDGKAVTADLAPRTALWAYHGRGDKPTKESVSNANGHVVLVRIAHRPPAGTPGTPGTSGTSGAAASAAPTASTTPGSGSTPPGPAVAAIIVDTGFTGQPAS